MATCHLPRQKFVVIRKNYTWSESWSPRRPGKKEALWEKIIVDKDGVQKAVEGQPDYFVIFNIPLR